MNAKISLVAALSVLALGGAAVAADLPRRTVAQVQMPVIGSADAQAVHVNARF